MWKGSRAGERPGQAGWHGYLPTGCGLSKLLQLGVGQVSVFTRQVCGWPRAVASLLPQGPLRASEYLAPQRVEGEVREGQSTSLVDRDPNPERQLMLGSTGDPRQVWDFIPGTPRVHSSLHTQLHTSPSWQGG